MEMLLILFFLKKNPDEQDQMLNAKMIKPRQELYTGPTDIMIRVTSPKILLKRSILEPLSLAIWDLEKIWSSH